MEWLIVAAVVVLLALRQSLLVLFSATLLLLYTIHSGGHPEYLVYDLWEAFNRDTLIVLPVFALASAIMNFGASTHRLMNLFQWLVRFSPPRFGPAALAIASLLAIVFASALCGSPSIALLSFGPALYRSLVDDGYTQSFSIGLLCSGSVVGVLLPLSTPLVIYGAIGQIELEGLFVYAAILALVIFVLLATYATLANFSRVTQVTADRPIANRDGADGNSADGDDKQARLNGAGRRALPALGAVLVLILALLTKRLTHAEACVLFLLAVLIAELGFYRELKPDVLLKAGQAACRQLGSVLPLVAVGVSLSVFLLYQQAPERVADWLNHTQLLGSDACESGSAYFVALTSLGLFFAGLIVDTSTAVYVVAPLLSGVAAQLHITPEPFGVMLVFNLAVGYLTPPNGMVLIAAMVAFRENFASVLTAVAPFLAVLWLGVVLSAFAALF